MNDLAISKIKTDGGTQPRESMDKKIVAEYAELLKNGVVMDPIDVFYDGVNYWLADGFHRVAAHAKNGLKTIAANVHQGDKREAILYSVGANAVHGLRRTNKDKRRAVLTLLNDKEWGKWSNREIAKRCAVSYEFVNQLRSSLTTAVSDNSARTYTTKQGTTATMNVSKIGAAIEKAFPAPGEKRPPYADFNQALDDFDEGVLEVAIQRLRKLMDFDSATKLPRNPWARFISHDLTIGMIKSIRKGLKDSRPGALSDKPPGYLPAYQVAVKKSLDEKKGGH